MKHFLIFQFVIIALCLAIVYGANIKIDSADLSIEKRDRCCETWYLLGSKMCSSIGANCRCC